MDDQAAADDARRAGRDGNDVEIRREAGVARVVGLEAGQVAGMALAGPVVRMRLAVRVEVPLGAQTVAAAIGCFVNVKSVLLPGAQAWDSAAQHASI